MNDLIKNHTIDKFSWWEVMHERIQITKRNTNKYHVAIYKNSRSRNYEQEMESYLRAGYAFALG